MVDFEVQRCTRKCAATDRDLQPGADIVSALVVDGGKTLRRDYEVNAWQEPPTGIVGWWRTTVPSLSARKTPLAPSDVILNLFLDLDQQKSQRDFQYVVTLLMIRRRIVRLESTETDDRGEEFMIVYCPKTEMEYRVASVSPPPERANEIQAALEQLLYPTAN